MSERKENLQSTVLPKEVLKKVTFGSPNRAIDSSVQALDLDKFSEWADELSLLSLQDRRGLERARVTYATRDGRVLVDNEVLLGERVLFGGQRIKTPIKFEKDRYGIYTMRAATVMHSHGAYDFPPSDIDTVPILLENADPCALSCVFVATTARKIIVFRTGVTQQLSQKEAEEYRQQWDFELSRRAGSHISFSHRVAQDHQQRVQEELFDEKAREMGLAMFVAPAEEQVAVRVSSLVTQEEPLAKRVFDRFRKGFNNA